MEKCYDCCVSMCLNLKTRKTFPTTVVGSLIGGGGGRKKEETNNDSQFPVFLGYFISNSVMNVAISLLAIAQKILFSIDAAA